VSGQAKDIVVVVLGFVLFADAHAEARNLMGVSLGFLGSIVYACSKMYARCTVEYWLGMNTSTQQQAQQQHVVLGAPLGGKLELPLRVADVADEENGPLLSSPSPAGSPSSHSIPQRLGVATRSPVQVEPLRAAS